MISTHRLVAAAASLAAALLLAVPARATTPDPAAARRGAATYGRYCVSCHGVAGDGRGPSAAWLEPRPRNFTSGMYKFRTTSASELPTDGDLRRSVERGLALTSMPHWRGLGPRELSDLVQYLKTLSPRFSEEEQGKPIAIPPRPAFTLTLVAKGKEIWAKAQCASCHGDGGKGDGSSWSTLKDEWGYPVAPRDLTTGILKAGGEPEDVYRTVMTGLTGSAMPSFSEAISPEEAWALVAYVRSLRKD
jgi:cytochrome c oxidase cbb3-type subunit I/II